MQEDLRWLNITWAGPMVSQSERIPRYRAALARLYAAGLIFPCTRSRRDVQEAAGAPHETWEGDRPVPSQPTEDEPVYPREFRPPVGAVIPPPGDKISVNWRFRVPDDAEITFHDAALGRQRAIAGRDFGDFLVWRKDDMPSYQLATVVDDIDFGITEVVRGADLVKSTFRQLLLFRALGHTPPGFYHAPLMLDDRGERLAKRHDALALRTLREAGKSPADLVHAFTP